MSHWQSKTTINLSDKLFSLFVRTRDKWHCQLKFRCNGLIDFQDDKGGLTCSHFHKRRHQSTRYDPFNGDAACRPCHQWVEDTAEGQKAYNEWKLKQLGEKEFKLLEFRRYQYQKTDEILARLYVKELLKTLG